MSQTLSLLKENAEVHEASFHRLLKELRRDSAITVREIEIYTGIGSCTLYNAEGASDVRVSSFLRLFLFYLCEKNYVFDHRLLAECISECMRSGKCLRLSVTDGKPDGEEGLLLGKGFEGEL